MCVCVCVRACVRVSKTSMCVSACVRTCVRVCVSDPRFIQFALGSCHAVHIDALSIELTCTSKGTTCKLH